MNKKILVTIFTLIFVLILGVTVQAKSSENLLKEEVEFYANSFDENDLENITKEDILKIYDEITEEYTNDVAFTVPETDKFLSIATLEALSVFVVILSAYTFLP